MHLREELASRSNIPSLRLEEYERAGIVGPGFNHQRYDSELKVSVIAKAESLGFTFDEIVMLLRAVS